MSPRKNSNEKEEAKRARWCPRSTVSRRLDVNVWSAELLDLFTREKKSNSVSLFIYLFQLTALSFWIKRLAKHFHGDHFIVVWGGQDHALLQDRPIRTLDQPKQESVRTHASSASCMHTFQSQSALLLLVDTLKCGFFTCVVRGFALL